MQQNTIVYKQKLQQIQLRQNKTNWEYQFNTTKHNTIQTQQTDQLNKMHRNTTKYKVNSETKYNFNGLRVTKTPGKQRL